MRRDPFRGQDQRERKGPLSWRDVVRFSNCQELPKPTKGFRNLPRDSETFRASYWGRRGIEATRWKGWTNASSRKGGVLFVGLFSIFWRRSGHPPYDLTVGGLGRIVTDPNRPTRRAADSGRL
jgi:hypothetical protein